MQKIDRKEFVQGVAALGVATVVDISFGEENRNMKKTELKTLAKENAFVVHWRGLDESMTAFGSGSIFLNRTGAILSWFTF